MAKVISAGTVRGFRERFRAEADALADELVARGRFDAITDLAERYPLKVFPDAVGLPAGGRQNLLPYGALAFNAFGPRNHLLEQALATAAPAQEWIWASCQRDALTPGGLGARLWALAGAGEISHEQAPMLVRSLLSAGVDTTVYGIGNTMQALTAHPGQWARLREKPSLARFAFDEALRYESPVQTFFRTTTREAEISGIRIPEREKVLLFLGAANRDPRRWGPQAGQMDITRKAAGHVAFGMGIHQCVGQPVARLEAELVLTALAERVERLEPAGDPVPKLNNTLKGWASVPSQCIPPDQTHCSRKRNAYPVEVEHPRPVPRREVNGRQYSAEILTGHPSRMSQIPRGRTRTRCARHREILSPAGKWY
jgi:cytochrome P450